MIAPTPRLSLTGALWIAAAVLLLLVGLLVDGTTEPGHHAALILGGAIIGYHIGRG